MGNQLKCVRGPSGRARSALAAAVRGVARRLFARAMRDDVAAAAVPSRGALMEAVESRRLLAVTWEFTIADFGNEFAQFHDEILDVMEASTGAWSDIFTSGADASIEVEVRFEDAGPGGFLAAAAPIVFEPIGLSGSLQLVEPGPSHEVKTGFDPNGATVDAYVVWNTAFLESGEIFTGTSPTRVVPSDSYDAVTISTHELGHVLGFMGLRSPFNGALTDRDANGRLQTTPYDNLVKFATGNIPYFNGNNARAVYGRRVGLTNLGRPGSSIYHVGGSLSPDLENDLMSFSVATGVRQDISILDEAILADIGMPVARDFPDPPPIGGAILVVNGTAGFDNISVTFTGGSWLIRRNGVLIDASGNPIQFDPFTNQPIGVPSFDDFGRVSVNGGAGNDRITLNGDVPASTLSGGAGDDTLTGGNGDDTLSGGTGNDVLNGGNGRDRLVGDSGRDRLFGGTGQDRIFGGSSGDFIDGGSSSDLIDAGVGNDFVAGAGGVDTIFGNDGNDTLHGGDGDDSLDGGLGADVFIGGGGTGDLVDFEERDGALNLSLDGVADDGEIGEGDNLLDGIEILVGGRGHDRMVGNAQSITFIGGLGRDTMIGGGRADIFSGGGGSNVMFGNGGNDTMIGGDGNDHIFAGSGVDRIRGMAGNDKIWAADRFHDIIAGGDGIDTVQGDQRDELDPDSTDDDLEEVSVIDVP